jgi:hypothetical protein
MPKHALTAMRPNCARWVLILINYSIKTNRHEDRQ